MYSTVGRPRMLSDAQVARILDWQRTRRTIAQLAAELGVSTGVVRACLSRGGRYKLPAPEQRAVNLRRRRLGLANAP